MIRGWLIVIVLAWGCDSAVSDHPVRESAEPEAAPDAGALLPAPGRLFSETQVRLVDGDERDVTRLADVETCGECHGDVVEVWRSSAHARASFDNPWYRQSVDSIRDDVGHSQSRFCAGCHDPLLLVSGAMDEEVRPEDPRAHAGITCLVCHGAQEARSDGVASITLSTAPVFLPDPADAEEVQRHVREVTPDPLRTAELCGACHRGFLGPEMGNAHHLPGIDDLTTWRRSGYAGSPATRVDEPVDRNTCQGCHMPMRTAVHGDFAADDHGQIHSHRFLGAHTAMAGATGDAAQLEELQAFLRTAARVDVASVRAGSEQFLPADGAPVRAGQAIELDVLVHNRGTGHRFPGGTIDAQDTWLEVEVRDAEGALVAEAGTQHAEGPDHDPEAHRLHAVLVGEDAEPQFTHRVHRFAAKVLDQTITPRDAQVVRYALDIPRRVHMPLSVQVRLRHRRHNRELHAAACASQSTERGRAFLRTSERLGRLPIDACRPQPITELAEARVFIGNDSETRQSSGGATERRWRRLFDHALALIGNVQEHLDDARPSLSAALREAPDARARAMVLAQRGRLEGRQGRLEAALADLAQAEALIGAQPSIHRLRGDAYAQVWRWTEAASAYAAAAEGAPNDESRWADLARAYGSTDEDSRALEAAVRGLALSPRDESLLRSQYLALVGLHGQGQEAAREAYLAHRTPDALPELRLDCARQHEWCGRERLPVHVHVLRAVR